MSIGASLATSLCSSSGRYHARTTRNENIATFTWSFLSALFVPSIAGQVLRFFFNFNFVRAHSSFLYRGRLTIFRVFFVCVTV